MPLSPIHRTRRREPVLRRRDWAMPPPAVRRAVREAQPAQDLGRPPLLLVHGAWHGAWCWEAWLPRLAEAGYPAYALDLRGHGDSQGGDELATTPLRFYEHDVLQTIASLPAPPVLVGHSMGGLVVQHVAERYRATPGIALVASVPPGHHLAALGLLGRHDPLALARAAVGARPRFRPRTLLGPTTPEDTAQARLARLGSESAVATNQLVLPRRRRDVRAPALVMGGGDDRVVGPADVVRTARELGTKAHLFRGLGHDLMLEDDHEGPLRLLLRWLDETVA